MPITVALPAATPDPTKTIFPQKCVLAFLPTSGTQENYRGKITFNQAVEKKTREVPGTDGVNEVDRTIITKKTKTAKFTFDEFTTESLAFMNNAQRTGTARIWIRDPADAANTVSLMTNEFNVTISLDGDVAFEDDFSKMTLGLDINGTLTWSLDASTTP